MTADRLREILAEGADPYTDEQLEELIELLASLATLYRQAMREKSVKIDYNKTGHN